jgi:lipid-A-disaccharide synthase
VVGIVEVLRKYRYIKSELDKLKANIRNDPPDLLILVDYQEFNQRLAAFAKSIGVTVLFYIGPQVWAWRPKRVYKMAKIVDHLAVILPFEKALYEKADIAVTFTGHPLADEVFPDKTREQARAEIGVNEQLTVGLFPGSRSGEIKRLLPILLDTAIIVKQKLARHGRRLQFVLPVAGTTKPEDFAPFSEKLESLNVHMSKAPFYDVAQACDVIATASGTAVLEIGLLETPMVIVYKIAQLSYSIAKHLVHLEHIGLVNIIPGKEIVKEFLQNEAQPDAIANEVLRLIDDPEYYENMRSELAKIRDQLGGGNGSKNVARLAFDMLQQHS